MSNENEIKWYKLTFEQVQPFHIGSLNYGVISETEIFIPGYTMWGALVNSYLRKYGFEKIEKIQKEFEKVTCFYPIYKNDVLCPKYKDGEFYLGDLSEDEFRIDFVDTVISTSIVPLSRYAKDESLHEFDAVFPGNIRKGEIKDIHPGDSNNHLKWIGILGLKNDGISEFLKEQPEILVGGDARYGFGLMRLIELSEVSEEELKDWNLDKDGSLYIEKEKNILRNFLIYEESTINFYKGETRIIPIFKFKKPDENDESKEFTKYIIDAKKVLSVGSEITLTKELSRKNYHLSKGIFIRQNKN